MKVLHVIPSLSRAHGGPTRALRLFEQALTQAGVEVETATTSDGGGALFGKPERIVSPEGIVRWVFPRALEFYKISPAFGGWIRRRAADYDLLHIHALFSFTSAAAALGARRSGVPYILRPLGTLMHFGIQSRHPLLKQISLRLLENRLLRGAGAVHVTSAEERRQTESLGVPMRCVTVPLAVEAAAGGSESALYERYPGLRGRRIVLFIGRLDPVKNLESLLLAFKRCLSEVPDAVLLIGGDGPPAYQAALRNRAEGLALGESVVWAGQLESELKAEALTAAEVFVLPSHSESFGIAAAEALVSGLPCVLGSGVAIACDVAAAEAGVVVAPAPASIAQGLLQLLRDPSLRTAMSARARQFSAGQYSVERMGRGLVRMYEEAIARAPERRRASGHPDGNPPRPGE